MFTGLNNIRQISEHKCQSLLSKSEIWGERERGRHIRKAFPLDFSGLDKEPQASMYTQAINKPTYNLAKM